MHREYYMRLAIVSVCALAVAVTAGAIALFPADIRARAADNAALQAVAAARKNSGLSDLNQAEQQLSQGRTLLAALQTDASQARFSAVIRSIVNIHSPVMISSFAMGRAGSSTVDVTLQGIAPTRNDLLAFKGRLEALSPGSTVDLPISTLAKNANISFSLKLTEPLK
ncbi:MAG: hypothetical protein JWO00_100 [Candidatus Parcubacteria bacterium]|nr:hypothetical protein [Candidatus Parcubacteria bacterium]